MTTEVVITDNLANVIKMIDDTSQARMEAAVQEVRNVVLDTLAGQRTGRRYKVPGTKDSYYTASAPGEAPAVATARLRPGIRGVVEEEDGNPVGYVGTDLEYGPMLEFGTKNMAARPWLRISFEKSRETVEGIFEKPWE
jgi:hypothetical protein